MGQMIQYKVTLTGLSALIMHKMNITYDAMVTAWQKDPANKELSVKADDRSPAFTWIGRLYHNSKHIGIDADCLMSCLRYGGAKVPNKGKETYKKQAQSGIIIDTEQWDLCVDKKKIKMKKILAMQNNLNFAEHVELAESLGFELFVKWVRVGRSRHIRVRPLFRNWKLKGTLTVIDDELYGLTKPVLKRVLNQAGALCGLGDWRPNSPGGGPFGKFKPFIKKM